MPWLQWGFEHFMTLSPRLGSTWTWGSTYWWDSKAGERFKRRLDRHDEKKADGESAKIERIGLSIHSPVQDPGREFAVKDRPERYARIRGMLGLTQALLGD